jgi:hypothetical protein
MNLLKLSAATAALTFAASFAMAEPVKLTKAELDNVVAGAITKTNGGGNTPNGAANGVPNTNPAGHAPGGHNK